MLLKPDSCRTCVGWGWGHDGYVPQNGGGENGVLVILEAAGADEALAGIPTVGAAGQFLWNQLHRVGIERDGFRIHNVLSCRPPGNHLAKMPYEHAAITSCAPNLDATIAEHVAHCKTISKTPVIIALGKIAFKRLMHVSDRDVIMKKDYIAYPFWRQDLQSWLIAGYHPSYLMQGSQHLTPILTYVFQRALEIAADGIKLDNLEGSYLEDPESATFDSWIDDYFWHLARQPETYLSYDIETPYKEGKDEAAITISDDQTPILRCSFSYQPGSAVSVPWKSNYYAGFARLFASAGPKIGWNSSQFDDPRIREYFPIAGDLIDGMLAWHVLNTSFPKALGFVTPFYAKTMSMWKHLDKERPAFYSACDADAALRCWLGIKADLHKNKLWDVFNRHVTEVHRVFSYMSQQGVVLDQQLRRESELKLQLLLDDIELKMAAAIPEEARKIDRIYKKEPKDKTGLSSRPGKRIESFCSHCGLARPGKPHFKRFAKKLNPCADDSPTRVQQREIDVVEWYRLGDWKISKLGLGNYQGVKKHSPIFDRRKGKVTYDEPAMMRLIRKYPSDKLYPLILDHREKAKLLSVYIGITQPNGLIRGGMPVGPDGKVHCTFTSNPSTLRSACQNPNLQNCPRPTNDLAAIIRNLFVASPGNILYARDFSGIEAVLVGYDAAAPGYMRLARRDVHTFYTAWALHELDPGRIPPNDLPLLSWDDDRLFSRLAELKGLLKKERNSLYKHLVHAANFMQSPKGAKEKIFAETGVEYPIDTVRRVMDIYFELFPEIKKWHSTVLLQAEKDGYLRNAFGYLHRFSHVFDYEKVDGKWQKHPNHDTANKVVAFGPQSNAAAIIKLAMLALSQGHFEEAGQWLRLLIHDELLFDTPISALEKLDAICQMVMEAPIKELPLPATYNLGPYLSILTEPKQGLRWGIMK